MPLRALAENEPTPNASLFTVDLTGVVSTLESHWVVLDAELSEIRKDFATLRALTRKHGEFWNRPMAQLKKLRVQKENLLKECVQGPPREGHGCVPADHAAAHKAPCTNSALGVRTSCNTPFYFSRVRLRSQDQIPDGALQPSHPAGARPLHQTVKRGVCHQDTASAAPVPAGH